MVGVKPKTKHGSFESDLDFDQGTVTQLNPELSTGQAHMSNFMVMQYQVVTFIFPSNNGFKILRRFPGATVKSGHPH